MPSDVLQICSCRVSQMPYYCLGQSTQIRLRSDQPYQSSNAINASAVNVPSTANFAGLNQSRSWRFDRLLISFWIVATQCWQVASGTCSVVMGVSPWFLLLCTFPSLEGQAE